MTYRLVIGNKNTSSWSLRPWLAMRHAGLAFSEVNINLRAADAKAQILAYSPSGRVPALLVEDRVIWDSLAILEFLAEAHPEAALWPRAPDARAQARSAAAEMHASFQPLRQHCPMDFLARAPAPAVVDEVAADVRRIVALWRECRRRFGTGGPFLFGPFSAADAMYAPVASRFRTYLPSLAAYGDDGTAQAYVETLFALPAMVEWGEGARRQTAASG
ncbi:MAG: glutathione S-transferase family protein [Hyphomonadaceae bacterium]|nr:glutathione S-transferase family protein [Hyphomonadaceae bacterium]